MDRFDDNETGNMNMTARWRESHGASHPSGIWGTAN
jgi:hypothetical protein